MPAHLRIARTRPAQYADALAEAVARLKHAKEAALAAEEIRLERENEVLTIMAGAGIKTSTVAADDERVRVSVVQNQRLEFNEQSLRKALTAPVFDKLCDLKLNRLKLEEAVADGRVDPVTVATYSTVKPSKVYVKLTQIQGSEQ